MRETLGKLFRRFVDYWTGHTRQNAQPENLTETCHQLRVPPPPRC